MNAGDITPEMLEAMPGEYRHELLLLLQVLERPKLARVSGTWPPSPESPWNQISLRESIEGGNKRAVTIIAEEAAQEEREEAALLDWYNRGGKDQQLHPIVQANIRVARAKLEPPADNAPTPRQEYDALAATKAAKPPEPEVKPEQDELLKLPAIETDVERRPRDIFEALDRQNRREPMCIGESLGSWRR